MTPVAGKVRLHKEQIGEFQPVKIKRQPEQHEEIVGGIDFQAAPQQKSTQIDRSGIAVLGEQQVRNQEARKHKEEINTYPACALPQMVILARRPRTSRIAMPRRTSRD